MSTEVKADYSKKLVIENRTIEWQEVAEGVKRKIMAYGEQIMLVRVAFEAGAIGLLHQHYHVQITNVESGVFEVEIDSKKHILKAGDVFYVPSNIMHGAVCIEQGVLIDVFSPKREDFIP